MIHVSSRHDNIHTLYILCRREATIVNRQLRTGLTSVAMRKEEDAAFLAVSGDKVVHNYSGILCDAPTEHTHPVLELERDAPV